METTVFSYNLLSVVKVDRAYPAQRPCKLPEFLFYGMDKFEFSMYGAILGDMVGAPYEFDRGDKSKDFPLFRKSSMFTDDTVMTIAVAEALMDTGGKSDEKTIRHALVNSIQKWGHKYPNAGYGGRFCS